MLSNFFRMTILKRFFSNIPVISVSFLLNASILFIKKQIFGNIILTCFEGFLGWSLETSTNVISTKSASINSTCIEITDVKNSYIVDIIIKVASTDCDCIAGTCSKSTWTKDDYIYSTDIKSAYIEIVSNINTYIEYSEMLLQSL